MNDGDVDDDFETFQRGVLDGLKPAPEDLIPLSGVESDPPAAAPSASASATPPGAAPSTGEGGAAKEPTVKDDSAATPPAEPAPAGSQRAAIRAARRETREARAREAAAKAENEALKAKLRDANLGEAEDPLKAKLDKLREEVPQAAEAIDLIVERLPAAPKPEPAAPAFEPDALDSEVQDAVDEVDELHEWQHDPKRQHLWAAAKAHDLAIKDADAWADKPMAERFKEVVARVKKDHGLSEKKPPDPAPQPATGSPSIGSLNDLGGGIAPKTEAPNFKRMSNQEITAYLTRLGA